ncbi:glutathione S-transferase 1-like [Cydia strobilella]|uniref:glutathione S-transferase 1-like n=1 Tax=Cydia strobilella TaxID=1100964 RepID=UPI00300655D2
MRLTNTLFNQACSTARLVLYKRDASPPSNAVRMVGAILGLQFEYVEPDIIKGEHKSPEYRKINPMSTIPVLKDGNLTVSESHAIILYLLNKYGGEHKEKLYPSDPATRAIVDQCLYFDAGVLFRQILDVSRPAFAGKSNGPSKKNIFDIEEGYAITEAYLESRPYMAADHLTVADISLGSTAAALHWIHALEANKFPKTIAWLERLSTESYFKEFNTPGAALLAKMLRHFWKQNNK